MAKYKLKDGSIIDTSEYSENQLMYFLGQNPDAQEVKMEDGVPGAVAPSEKVQAPDTDLQQEAGSSDSPKTEKRRYITYSQQGKDVTLYEDDYLEKYAGKGRYPKTFDEYAKTRKEFGEIKTRTYEPLESVTIKGKASDNIIKAKKAAKELNDKVESITADTEKNKIVLDYFGIDEDLNDAGFLENNFRLPAEAREQYFPTKLDSEGKPIKYRGKELKSNRAEYKNTFDEDLKNYLGQKKFEQWQALKAKADEKGVTLNKDNVSYFISLEDVDNSTKQAVINKKRKSESEIYLRDFSEEEQDNIRRFIGDEAVLDKKQQLFNEAARVKHQSTLRAEKDKKDYFELTGRPLLRKEVINGVTYDPRIIKLDMDVAYSDILKQREQELVKKQNDLISDSKKFQVDYEALLKAQNDVESYTAEDINVYNSESEVAKRKNLLETYTNLWNKVTQEQQRLENISEELSEDIRVFGNTKIMDNALLKNYEYSDKFAHVMEEAFLGSGAMLGASIEKGIGDLAVALNLADEEGSWYQDKVKSKGAAIDYNRQLQEYRTTYLPDRLTSADSSSTGQYLADMLVENSPSILVALSTSGAGALAAGGGAVARAAAVRSATNLASSVFFVMEAGGQMSSLEIAQQDAKKMLDLKIPGNLFEQLEQAKKSGLSGFEIKSIEKQIEEQQNLANLNQFQKSFNSVVYGGIASLAERFGSLNFINNFQKYSKSIGGDVFRKQFGDALGTKIAKGAGVGFGVGSGVVIEQFEEGITLIGQNMADNLIFRPKEPVSLIRGLDGEFFRNTLVTSLGISGPSVSSNIYTGIKNEITTRAQAKKEGAIRDELIEVQREIRNTDLRTKQGKKLKQRRDELINEAADLNTSIMLSGNNLSDADINTIFDNAAEIQRLKYEALDLSATDFNRKEFERLRKKAQGLFDQNQEILEKNDKNLAAEAAKMENPVEAAALLKLNKEFKDIAKSNKDSNYNEFNNVQELISFLNKKTTTKLGLSEDDINTISNVESEISKLGLDENLSAEDVANKKEELIQGLTSYLDNKNFKNSDVIIGYLNGYNAGQLDNDILIFNPNIRQNIANGGINAEIAAVSPLHELGHWQAKNAGVIRDDALVAESANDVVKSVITEVEARNKRGELTDEMLAEFNKRIEAYRDKKYTETEGVDADELLQLVSDFTALGILEKNNYDAVFGLKTFANSIVKKFNPGKENLFKIRKASDVFNFVSQWQNKAFEFRLSGQSEPSEETKFSKTPLEAINDLVPNTVKTQMDFYKLLDDPRVEQRIFDGKKLAPVIENYIRQKSGTAEIAAKNIESVKDRLINFDPEKTRKDGTVIGPKGFGEFIFANANFGKLDAKKALAIEAKRKKEAESLDSEKAKQITGDAGAVQESKAPKKPVYRKLVNSGVLPGETLRSLKEKVIKSVRVLKTRLDAKVSKNQSISPIMREIKNEVSKQIDIELKKAMGGAKDGKLQDWLIKNKKAVLENATTSWLAKAVPITIEKSVDGKYVSWPAWKDKEIDRESAAETGKTSGGQLMRRISNPADRISDADFVGTVLTNVVADKDGNVISSGIPIRGKKESMAKELAGEFGIEIVGESLKDPKDPLRIAFEANQDMLGAVLADNYVQEFSRQAERGNIKFSKTLFDLDNKTPGILNAFIDKMQEDAFSSMLSANKGNIKNTIRYYFKDFAAQYNIKLGDLTKISNEINDNALTKNYQFQAKKVGPKTAVAMLTDALVEELYVPGEYKAIFAKYGLKSNYNLRSLDAVNEGRLAALWIRNKISEEDFVRGLYSALSKPARLAGFEIKGDIKNIAVTLTDIAREVKTARNSLFNNVQDINDNLNIQRKPGDQRPSEQTEKNWWFSNKFNKLDDAGKISYLEDLYNNGQEDKRILLNTVEAIREGYSNGDISSTGAQMVLVGQFADMTGVGKAAGAPRFIPVIVNEDGSFKVATDEDLVKADLAYKKDPYVLEHMIPAKRISTLSLQYILTGDKSILDQLKLELENYDTSILPKKLDDVLKENGLQEDMGLDYKPGDSPIDTRYYGLGVQFYDAKEKRVVGSSVKFSKAELSKINTEQKAINNAVKFSYAENPKGISVWDFDDTLATTESNVLYTMPNAEGGFSEGSTNLKAIFMVGGPGAGKTNVGKGLQLGRRGYKVVNQDIALEAMKEEAGLPAKESDYTAEQRSMRSKLGAAARKAAVAKFDKYAAAGDGMVIDGTGASYNATTKKIKALQDLGYEVHMVVAMTPLETAIERNKARTERSLPDFVVEKTYNQVQESLAKYKKDFGDRLYEINTETIEYGKPLPSDFLQKVYAGINKNKVGKINATQFAEQSNNLENMGAKFDFREFSQVKKGDKGPMFEKALARNRKFGNDNVFILTARPADSKYAIHEFLKGIGLDILIDNIVGLGNGTAQAKADWMVGKVAEGYNDFYFADDAVKNVDAVKEVLDNFDVKGRVQQAKIKFSKDVNKEFNAMIERNKGVKMEATFSAVLAKKKGAKKGRFKIFLPAGAEDFRGLTSYVFAGKGKQGERDQQFFEDTLIKPYMRGVAAMERAKQSLRRDYAALLKSVPGIKKRLSKKIGDTDYTVDQAIRVYIWTKQGQEIPDLSKRDQKKLVSLVSKESDLVGFAQGLEAISKSDKWVEPGEYWLVGSLLKDVNDIGESVKRKEYLAEFIENVDLIFSKQNLNKVEAVYGTRQREALEDIIRRMKSGSNAPAQPGKYERKWLNWINNSTGTIMFFNRKSALLQLMSTVNFTNWSDNNPINQALAFANQPLYWKTWAKIFNSDKLKERRGGLKSDVQEQEIANQAKTSKDKASAIISYLLKIGFTPTQIADSMAIASGGAPFLINRTKTYVKQGMSKEEAESKAWEDFSALSDETQQSGDAMLISAQQASHLGRLILAFQNTPMQVTRLFKKAALDLINRRGSDRANISRLLYYGFIQNVIFSALQNALFALIPGFDEDEDDEKKTKQEEKKIIKTLNSVLDTLLRGSGLTGAVISTIKNTIIKYYEQEEKGRNKDHAYTLLELTNVSPPIGSKIRKVYSSLTTKDFNKDVMEAQGWSPTLRGRFNIAPNYEVVAGLSSALLNIPLDRLIAEVDAVSEALDSRNTAYQRLALGLGYRTWDINAKKEEEGVVKAVAKLKRKTKAKEKAAETRELKKQIELDRLSRMTPKEKADYLRAEKIKRQESARKAAKTRRENKRKKDSILRSN